MKKIAITGHLGNIGSRLVKLGAEPLCCDITNPKDVAENLHRVKPDVVLHLAAQTSVDWCEKNYQEAISVNVFGTNVVCEQAEKEIGAGKVVLISSDQVFDGKKGNYSEDDILNPINNYGFTKLGAEMVAKLYGDKIVRISRCFDSNSKDIREYINTLRSGHLISVPYHISRSYCHFDFMAEALFKYANVYESMPDVLNIAGKNPCSFVALMQDIALALQLNVEYVNGRGDKSEYIKRPHKGGLDVTLANNLRIPIHSISESVARLRNELA